MFDWMTAGVEFCGACILCVWIVVPIGEFREIFRRIRERDREARKNGGKR